MADEDPRSRNAETTRDSDAVEVLDLLVRRAVGARASDIHLEPSRRALRVRFRIDGIIQDQGTLPVELVGALGSRIKVLAKMDMTERRLPQDGQFTARLDESKHVHVRVSTFPALHGETLVLRLLLGNTLIGMAQLGMEEADMATVREVISLPSGLILVCGPTGSGKTSTLYSILDQLDTKNLSVVTLEDPVEIEFSHVTQGQTNPRAGFTFATGLRAILRQDPDVIMVGEMRDNETAQIALQASLTGHLVMSTLHTSSSVETIARVIDLGAEPWIVANALQAVIAQRLVRVLCQHCAESYVLPVDVTTGARSAETLLAAGTNVRRPRGCGQCHNTGYAGRTAIFEVLNVDDDFRDLIRRRATSREYREALVRMSIRSLREAGVQKVREGVTSVDEVLRVT